ncbi:MAG: hypothetical protein NT158_09400 [Cyanobacteria bacterium]|nr:hypothetical protein [Cyanobacteriota bacterium]
MTNTVVLSSLRGEVQCIHDADLSMMHEACITDALPGPFSPFL